MDIKTQLQKDMIEAMKAKEVVRLETIRFMKSVIQNAEIDAGELDNDAVEKLLQKEVKKRKESIAQFREAGRSQMAEDEQGKLKIIQRYLPEMMSEAEVTTIIDEVINSGASDFGQVMGQVMAKTKGQADGNLVSKIVREKLG